MAFTYSFIDISDHSGAGQSQGFAILQHGRRSSDLETRVMTSHLAASSDLHGALAVAVKWPSGLLPRQNHPSASNGLVECRERIRSGGPSIAVRRTCYRVLYDSSQEVRCSHFVRPS